MLDEAGELMGAIVGDGNVILVISISARSCGLEALTYEHLHKACPMKCRSASNATVLMKRPM
ncbi:hypothetical protein WK68_12950 [Burkholderia ubonensis]|nr:hypothetical protein WK68_12950 [Burkholderia ubonensis]